MKKKYVFVPLLLLLSLLLFPGAALAGAKNGVLLWWERVFPALLPYLVCCGLLEKTGVFASLQQKKKGKLLTPAVAAFGFLTGAPAGARLLGGLEREGVYTKAETAALAPACNLTSPAFLLSIIALGLYENKALFLPLALGHYFSALLLLLTVKKPAVKLALKEPASPPSFVIGLTEALSEALSEAMLNMLKIGGCIIFSCVLLSVALTLLPLKSALFTALLSGLVEVTAGAAALPATSLPLRLQLSLCAFFCGFGGLSIALQTRCFLSLPSFGGYLLKKLLLGCVSFCLCYLSFPLFPLVQSSGAFPLKEDTLFRLSAGAGLLASMVFSLLFILLFSLIAAKPFRSGKAQSGQTNRNQL